MNRSTCLFSNEVSFMHESSSKRRPVPFDFVIEELASLRPTIKTAFGFTYVYLDEKLLCSLRNDTKRPGTNGMWLFTTTEYIDSLMKEFPDLPKRQVWRSGKNCWVVLASRLEGFEEYAFKACELILNGDPRIGRITHRSRPERGRRSERNPALSARSADDKPLERNTPSSVKTLHPPLI